ncbi:uncharacterized protein PHACADRAFT_246663 [Phanerochaete carnosa HHB-10118-sp]|uniref:Uncharacterized protein n=1 Tax=Phanerochaete carnosa (strain HHB-10118-sp) TaxID=650164 RepID=K5VCH1_PHACS|nr:uncharacterized protein PHACADRAFT_246663 [Phanerochaete carnosa HHB-10118-sp]EKM60631.1 hypothetical protein PHACADRAFT_246663 [Phanerochaete carnosa HHB-10118-sp]
MSQLQDGDRAAFAKAFYDTLSEERHDKAAHMGLGSEVRFKNTARAMCSAQHARRATLCTSSCAQHLTDIPCAYLLPASSILVQRSKSASIYLYAPAHSRVCPIFSDERDYRVSRRSGARLQLSTRMLFTG